MESGESGRVKQQIIWKINRLSRAGSLKADQKLGCLSPSGQLQPDSWNWAMIHPYHPYKDLLFKFEASISIQLQLNSYIPSYLLCLFTSYTWGPLVNFFFTTTPPLLLSPPARPPIPLPFPLFLTQGPTGPPQHGLRGRAPLPPMARPPGWSAAGGSLQPAPMGTTSRVGHRQPHG
jgi:hypothetical protein